MGAAAPFLRRVLPLSVLLAVGVVAFVRLPAFDVDAPPQMGSEAIDAYETNSPVLKAVSVEMGTGWFVPDLELVADPDDAPLSETLPAQTLLAPGMETVGASVSVAADATMALIHGSGPRSLAMRVKDDEWGPWVRLHMDYEEGPDAVSLGATGQNPLAGEEGADGTYPVLGPLWLGADASAIELMVLGGSQDDLAVTFLGETPGPRSVSDNEVFEPAAAAAGGPGAPELPAIIPRAQWAGAGWDYDNESCDDGPAVSDHVQAMVIHHTVTTNSYTESDVDDLLRAIYHGHVRVNGWCDIGYNFIVDRFGRIWEARTGSIEEAIIGGHSRGFNTSTIGVALLGQHHPGASPSAAAPSTAAEMAIESLANWKLGIHGVDPAGNGWLRNRSTRPPLRLAGASWHYLPTVLSHRDLGVTSCPGNHGDTMVDRLPAALTARRDLSLPYTFVEWRPHSHGPAFIVADALGGIRPAGGAEVWSQAPAGLAGDTAIAVGATVDGGYLLTAAGNLVSIGSSPPVSGRPGGSAAPVDLVVRSDGASGWVLDGGGVLHGFGGVSNINSGSNSGPAYTSPAVAVSLDDAGNGYVVDGAGGLHPVGTAAAEPTPPSLVDGAVAVDFDLMAGGLASGAGGPAGWLLDDRGFVHPVGGGVAAGQTPLRVYPPEAVRAVVAAETGPGGWVLDADGQLWPFGGARLVFPVSTNAVAANGVDADLAGTVYRPSFVDGADARFISAVNRLFLGNSPPIEEVDLAVTDLEQGGDRIDITSAMARSEPWSAGALDQMYRDVLGREPDGDGRSYWLGEIASGLNLQDLGTYFYGSREYAERAGSTIAYVTGLYESLLGRQPDNDGLAYWVDALESAIAAPPDVANGFYASVESRRDRARLLHERILGTTPPPDRLDELADQLLVHGDAGLAAELAASSDYYDLAAAGLEP